MTGISIALLVNNLLLLMILINIVTMEKKTVDLLIELLEDEDETECTHT